MNPLLVSAALYATQNAAERKRPKCDLAELASMKNGPPTYHFTESVTVTLEINGSSYTGATANNLEEAANRAAFEAIWAIDPIL